MARMTIKELEQMTKSKYIGTINIKLSDPIFGDERKRTMEFDIFDGFAYCANYQGKEYYMDYPKLAFAKIAKDIDHNVREFMELDEHTPLKETDMLASYNTLYVNEVAC